MDGTIKSLQADKGFGFIMAGNTEYFFHRSAVKNRRFDELREGQSVTFQDTTSAKGPRAEDIYAEA